MFKRFTEALHCFYTTTISLCSLKIYYIMKLPSSNLKSFFSRLKKDLDQHDLELSMFMA